MNNVARSQCISEQTKTAQERESPIEVSIPLDVLDDFFVELGERNLDAHDSPVEDTFMLCSSELNRYMRVQQISTNRDPLKWWSENAVKFPILGVLAVRYLSIPATSAPSERLWSIASLIITKTRSQIDGHLVADIIFLKENGHILSKHAESIEGRKRVLPTVYEKDITLDVDD